MQVASERELAAAIEAMTVISLAGHRSLQHFIHPATQQRLSARTLIHMGSGQFWLQGEQVFFLLQSTVLINFQSPDITEGVHGLLPGELIRQYVSVKKQNGG